MSLSVILAAGGTGGHMIPAHALSEELLRRGHRVTLLTDARGLRFPGLFGSVDRHVLASATASGPNPVAWAKAAIAIWKGRAEGRRIAAEVGADAVVGFGGYPSLPGLLAGVSLKLPCVLHEQNAVLGRVNRKLQGRVSAIALTYAETAFLNGRPEQALIQLQNLKQRDDLDYYARSRIDARIATITPQVLELRRQGINDPDVERR